MRSLAERILDAANLRDLATDVEMNQLQTVLHSVLVDIVECREEFTAGKAKLAGIATAFLPFSTAGSSELDAYADVRTHIQVLGNLRNGVQFVEFLHHDEHALTHLLGKQSQFNVALVLIAVADDEGVAFHVHRQHGMELRLGTRFQSQVVLLSVADDFLHHRTNLIHLDRIDDEVLGRVAVFFRGILETSCRLLNTVVDDVGETNQHRGCYIAQREVVHHLFQVNFHSVLPWSGNNVSFVVDVEIVHAPAANAIQLTGVFNAPFSHVKFLRLVLGKSDSHIW